MKKKQYTKFKDKENAGVLQELYYAKKFKYFYYAVPKQLEDVALLMIPEFIGLYVYENIGYPNIPTFKRVKEAKKLKTERWSEKHKIELMRLGCMRIESLKQGLSYRR